MTPPQRESFPPAERLPARLPLRSRRPVLVVAGIAVALLAVAFSFFVRGAVVLADDDEGALLYGTSRRSAAVARASLRLWSPVLIARVDVAADGRAAAAAVSAALGPLPLRCAVFPYRYVDGAILFSSVAPESRVVVLDTEGRSARELVAGGGRPTATVSPEGSGPLFLGTDLRRAFGAAGRLAAILAEAPGSSTADPGTAAADSGFPDAAAKGPAAPAPRKGRFFLSLRPGAAAAGEERAFREGLSVGTSPAVGQDRPTAGLVAAPATDPGLLVSRDGSWSIPGGEPVLVAVGAALPRAPLDETLGDYFILRTWVDPALLGSRVVAVIDDSPYVLLVASVRAAEAGSPAPLEPRLGLIAASDLPAEIARRFRRTFSAGPDR